MLIITDEVVERVKRKNLVRWVSPQSVSVASAHPKELLTVWVLMLVAGAPTTKVPKSRPE